MDFTFFRYNDYLEIFDGSSNTAPFLTRWGGYGYFGLPNKILKCDGDEKCSELQECSRDSKCHISSIEETAVELISGSSTLVTPKQWVEKVHIKPWTSTYKLLLSKPNVNGSLW